MACWHYNRFRYYDPGVGRYVSADPIGQAGGPNSYAYARANPNRYIDLLGLAGLTPEQCAKLREMLKFEKEHGTWATAVEYGDLTAGFGDTDLSPELGPNVGVDSTAGEVDLDWFTSIRQFNLGSSAGSDSTYVAGKTIWNIGKSFVDDPAVSGSTWPYEDPKEKRLLDAMRQGYQSYDDFFTEDFMKENCDEPCE